MARSLVFSSLLSLLALLAVPALDARADTLRVPSQYPTIQEAIDASHDGDTVLVAPGTYVQGLTIHYRKILALESESGAEATIIDGAGARAAIDIDASDIATRTDYRITGFTIRNGRECGIWNERGRVHIESNIVTGNMPSGEGYNCGAIRFQDGGGSIRHNAIERNFNTGVWLINPDDVMVEGNRIEDNVNGGIRVYQTLARQGGAKLVRNVVKGGAWLLEASGPVHMLAADNLFVAGRLRDLEVLYFSGDGLTGDFVNNTVVANTGSRPLAAFIGDISDLALANNVFYTGNDAFALTCYTFGGGSPSMHHNVAYSASGLPISGDECLDAFAKGRGNISVEPKFAMGQGGSRWKLSPDSPLVDQGDNEAIGHLHRDIRGAPRIIDGGHGAVVDMGAFEYLPK